MIGLAEEFSKLPIPNTTSKHAYSARAINGFSNHRIAKDAKENPCLLISVSQSNETFKVANQRLYNLQVTHNLACEVVLDKDLEKQHFSVISYNGNDDELKAYFLNSCEILLHSLGNRPDNRKIKEVVARFIELFRVLNEPPKKTMQGLWAELFLISEAANPEKLVKGWHTIPEEKYDFSFGKIRMEVKSSATGKREHHFSRRQLTPPSGCRVFVASVLVEMVAEGKSIADLVREITQKLKGNYELIEKLNFVTSSTLGNSIQQIHDIHFDYELAIDTLQFFDAESIPKIKELPEFVSEVKFKSSLEQVDPVPALPNEIGYH